MSKFLDKFLVTMPAMQRKKLTEIIEMKKESGSIRTQAQIKAAFDAMLQDIEKRNGQITFQARHQSGQTNSSKYNLNLEEIAFDLASLYAASEAVDRLLFDNNQLARSLLSNINKQILTLLARIERYKMLMQNTDSHIDGIFEQFKIPELTETYEETLRTYRVDRFDKSYPSTYNAENIGESLQLASEQSEDKIRGRGGRKNATMRVTKRMGNYSADTQHNAEMAIDGSRDTYWAEAAIVDAPITQNDSTNWGLGYENIANASGALCEFELNLHQAAEITDIHFDPYCSYPVEIVSIYGFETEMNDSKVYEIVTPNHESVHQRSKKSTNKISYQFPAVVVSKLVFLIRQENYVKENYLIDEARQHDADMWSQLTSQGDLIPDYKDPDETMASFNKKLEITGWNVYLNALARYGQEKNENTIIEMAQNAMEVVRLGDFTNPLLLQIQSMYPEEQANIEKDEQLKKKWIAVNQFSYVYGAYEINVYSRKYISRSFYVSKPLPISSNSVKLSLSTVEENHEVYVAPATRAKITDIEYYITYKKNPLNKDWIAILPTEKQYVECELLSGDEGGESPSFLAYEQSTGRSLITYSLRFQCVSPSTLVVRRNGVPISRDSFFVSEDCKRIAIKEEYFSSSSVYTVDYKTVDSAYEILIDEQVVQPTQFIDNNGETGEFFLEAGQHNSVTLKHKPYLFRKDIFEYNDTTLQYEEVEEQTAINSPTFPMNIRVNGKDFYNVTNYTTNSYEEDDLKNNEGYSFAQIGNEVFFGRPIDGHEIKNIRIDYHYIATDIRLKAILRRNSTENQSITPSLYSYKIKAQSFDQNI